MPERPVAGAPGSADPSAAATITELPGKVRNRVRRGSAAAASAPQKPRRMPGRPLSRRSWRAVLGWPFAAGSGIWLEPAGPVPGTVPGGRAAGPLLAVAVAALAAAQYATGRPIAVAWLAIVPLLASLVLRPVRTALLAAWTVLLGLGLALDRPGSADRLGSPLSVLVLLAAFAVANSVLRCAAQRRLGQARAAARVAQSALLREVPRSVAAARLASRYLSASAEAQVGGDLLEVVADGGNPRWLVGDTRGKGLPAVRLASVAATSFRDACAQPGLSLTEVARAVDLSVTRAAGQEDFVTAVFAELDPRGWLQLVNCGHPPPLRLSADGDLAALAPAAFATPLGLHPDLHLSTFSVRGGDRLLFFTDGLLEARDRAGRFFRLDQQINALLKPDLQAAGQAGGTGRCLTYWCTAEGVIAIHEAPAFGKVVYPADDPPAVPPCRMTSPGQRAYLVPMPPMARPAYAATYVNDINASRAFTNGLASASSGQGGPRRPRGQPFAALAEAATVVGELDPQLALSGRDGMVGPDVGAVDAEEVVTERRLAVLEVERPAADLPAELEQHPAGAAWGMPS
jgi:phosphoserine phosphatase RsbU/P